MNEKVTRENIAGASIRFAPDVAVANVEYWFYDFDTSGSEVHACNSNGNHYIATGWTVDESTSTVKVYFGSDWEEYTLISDDSSLESGRFEYDNSNGGQEMEGEWNRTSSISSWCR